MILGIISPSFFVWVAFVSYFFLLSVLDFASPVVATHLALLGVLTVGVGTCLLRPRLRAVQIDRDEAGVLFVACILVLAPIFAYAVFISRGSVSALVDQRFSVPGYGVIYPFYFCATLVGAGVFVTVRGVVLKSAFVLFVAYGGFVFGGKGFVLPILWGVGLAHHTGLVSLNGGKVVALLSVAVVGAIAAVFSVVQSAAGVVAVLVARVRLAADAVNWVSMMDSRDVERFPISQSAFFVDLFSRFAGVRIHPRPVGSEIAVIVKGDDSGGGPNPLLPVLGYLLNQGNLLAAILFCAGCLAAMWFLLKFLRGLNSGGGPLALVLSAMALVFPVGIMDIVMLMQFLFALTTLVVVCCVLRPRLLVPRPTVLSNASLVEAA